MMSHQNLDSSEIQNYCQMYYQLILIVSFSSLVSFDHRLFLSKHIVNVLILLQCLHFLIHHFENHYR